MNFNYNIIYNNKNNIKLCLFCYIYIKLIPTSVIDRNQLLLFINANKNRCVYNIFRLQKCM